MGNNKAAPDGAVLTLLEDFRLQLPQHRTTAPQAQTVQLLLSPVARTETFEEVDKSAQVCRECTVIRQMLNCLLTQIANRAKKIIGTERQTGEERGIYMTLRSLNMAVGARVSVVLTAGQLGFSHWQNRLRGAQEEWSQNRWDPVSLQQLRGGKCIVDVRLVGDWAHTQTHTHKDYSLN